MEQMNFDVTSPGHLKCKILLPGISVTAPIRRSTPWALIKKKNSVQTPMGAAKD